MAGITTVVAVVFMLVIVIVIVGFSAAFFFRIQESGSKTLEETASNYSQQVAGIFKIEGTGQNKVYIRNLGSTDISNLAFYVDDESIGHTGPALIEPNKIGVYELDDAALALLGDIELLRVTATGSEDTEKNPSFYKNEIIFSCNFENNFLCDGVAPVTANAVLQPSLFSKELSTGNDARALYHFNKGYGITVCDETANYNVGIPGNIMWSNDSVKGASVMFDGIDDYFYIDDDTSLQISGSLTVETWIKPPNSSANTVILSKGVFPDVSFRLVQQKTGGQDIVKFIIFQGLTQNSVDAAINISLWQHIAGVFDADAQVLKIYVNGELKNSLPVTISTLGDINSNIYIGSDGGSNFYKGLIDELAFYGTALGDNEIRQHYLDVAHAAFVNKLLTYPALNNINTKTRGTVEFWAKPTAETGPLFEADGCIFRFIRNMPDLIFTYNTTTAQNATDVDNAKWRHVAITWNTTSIALYVDGVQKASTQKTDSCEEPALIYLGSDKNGNAGNVTIENLRIYDVARPYGG